MTLAPGAHTALAVLGVLAALLYLMPTTVAIARDVVAKTEVILLNLLLGWTGLGWLWALVLALGARHPQAQPTLPPPRTHSATASVYQDGVYLVSSGPDTHTWAIRENGGWNIVYEIDGEERLTGSVPESDVPLSVLAAALDRDGE
jgi:hypothetical protein